MSIEKVNHKSYVVWDNVGNFVHFIGTLAQCVYYVDNFDLHPNPQHTVWFCETVAHSSMLLPESEIGTPVVDTS